MPFACPIQLPKALLHQFFQRPIFRRLGCVGLDEMVRLGFEFFVEAEDVICGDEVNDPCRRHAKDLMLQDMPDAFFVVRVRSLDRLAAIESLDDLRDIQPRFHRQIGKGLVGIVETVRILPLQLVHHHLDDAFRRNDLVGLLRRDVVEDVLRLVFVEVVRQFPALTYEYIIIVLSLHGFRPYVIIFSPINTTHSAMLTLSKVPTR